MWLGMVFVIGGLVTVGVSDMMNQKSCNGTDINNNSTNVFNAEFSYAPISVLSQKLHGGSDCKNDTTSIFVGDLLIFGSQLWLYCSSLSLSFMLVPVLAMAPDSFLKMP